MKGDPAVMSLAFLLFLGLAAPRPASGERTLPDFRLNSVKISGIPRLAFGEVPPVPPPTDTGYYSRAGLGAVRLDSSIKVTVAGGTGRAEISFPAVQRGYGSGARSSLFIKFLPQSPDPVLSWASVVCSGRQYLGYKGASLKLPGKDAEFAIKDDNLSLGPMKVLLGRTHPWVIPAADRDGFNNLDRLCASDFPAKMKAYSVKALPRGAGRYRFKYDPSQNTLTVTWGKER